MNTEKETFSGSKKWIKDLYYNEIIVVTSRKKAMKLFEKLDSLGLKPMYGKTYCNSGYYENYKKNTFFRPFQGTYGNLKICDFNKDNIYTLSDLKDFDSNFTQVSDEVKFTYEDFKAGKFAFENDGTVEELRGCIGDKKSFGNFKYYAYTTGLYFNYDYFNEKPDLPIVRVTEFLKQPITLDEAIARAKPNMDKIKNVDDAVMEAKGEVKEKTFPREMWVSENEIKYSKRYVIGMWENFFLGKKNTNSYSLYEYAKEIEEKKIELPEGFVSVKNKLPEEGISVLILTDYEKMDVCRLRLEEDKSPNWVNDMRPQHSNGSVIAWCHLPIINH